MKDMKDRKLDSLKIQSQLDHFRNEIKKMKVFSEEKTAELASMRERKTATFNVARFETERGIKRIKDNSLRSLAALSNMPDPKQNGNISSSSNISDPKCKVRKPHYDAHNNMVQVMSFKESLRKEFDALKLQVANLNRCISTNNNTTGIRDTSSQRTKDLHDFSKKDVRSSNNVPSTPKKKHPASPMMYSPKSTTGFRDIPSPTTKDLENYVASMQVEHKLENTPEIIRHGRKISDVEAEGYALHSTKKDLRSSHAVPSTQKKTQPTPPGKDDNEMENIRLQDKANMLSSKLHDVSELLSLSNTNAEYAKTCLKAETVKVEALLSGKKTLEREIISLKYSVKNQRQKLAEKEYHITELKDSLSQKTSETECLTKDILILHGSLVADRKKLEDMALENEKFGQDIISLRRQLRYLKLEQSNLRTLQENEAPNYKLSTSHAGQSPLLSRKSSLSY